MRTLRFVVEEQALQKDDTCDFSGIVSGTKGYLEAEFKFNSTWNNYGKVAVFVSLLNEYPAILKNNKCVIPAEVLDGDKFSVYVVGSKNGSKLTTNSVVVEQERREPWLR